MAHARTRQKRKIMLIVEDQALLRFSLRMLLRRAYPDWTIEEAADGASALSACAALRPDLVLMDIHLPDASGIDLIPQVLALLPDAQVIVVSAESGADCIERARAAGATYYVIKDAIYTALLPAIAHVLARK